jgi:MFS superfamily sulfate permease-like transporter
MFVWFGAMPSCHGAGGLAAQHRFGARSSMSMLFIGGMKLLVGVIFGRTLQEFCTALPNCVLGMLLAFTGLELALAAKCDKTVRRRDQLVLMGTAGAEIALKSGIAFLVGLFISALLYLVHRNEEDTSKKSKVETETNASFGEDDDGAFLDRK